MLLFLTFTATTALRAVLADIKKHGTDEIICLGDTISLGPQPLETLNALKELNCIYIMGNHDEAILDPEKAPEFEITEHLVPDLYWCRDQLHRTVLNF
ncbi:MAG: metallophosphoesterase [Anaerolineales bacterium]|nr:metallophosphoesterase [Anaerolineales bacterium]